MDSEALDSADGFFSRVIQEIRGCWITLIYTSNPRASTSDGSRLPLSFWIQN